MINAHKVLTELHFERLSGSAGETRAIKVFEKYFKDLKVKHHLELFQLYSFDTGTATIKVAGKTFQAHPYGLTRNHIVSGELVFVEDLDAIRHHKQSHSNKIMLTYHAGRNMNEILKKAGAVGLIVIGGPLREAHSASHRQPSQKTGYIPSVTVKYQDGIKLSHMSGSNAVMTIKQNVEKRTARNIVVDIPGSGNEKTLTLAVGHYDTVARSRGISDNGGGVVSLLKLIEYFSINKPKRDLRVVFFSGEELGLLGSFDYIKKHKKEIVDRLGLVVNVDVSGDDIGRNKFVVLGTNQLLGYVDGVAKESGLFFRSLLDIYSSDCMPFTVHEIPSVNIARDGGHGSFYIHTPGDTIEHSSARGLQPTIDASINLLERVLNAGIYPVKREIDHSLKDRIEKYLWHSLLTKPKLEWKPEYEK